MGIGLTRPFANSALDQLVPLQTRPSTNSSLCNYQLGPLPSTRHTVSERCNYQLGPFFRPPRNLYLLLQPLPHKNDQQSHQRQPAFYHRYELVGLLHVRRIKLLFYGSLLINTDIGGNLILKENLWIKYGSSKKKHLLLVSSVYAHPKQHTVACIGTLPLDMPDFL